MASKQRELEGLRPRAAELEREAAEAPPARDLRAALSRPAEVALIAECKRRSPGAGDIRTDLDPVALTRGYEAAGASALSVLTDGPFFGGSLGDLRQVREATGIPVMRKDFTLDRLHLLEARAAGADAVLLIVRLLTSEQLRDLLGGARELGLSVLVEAHDGRELREAVDAGADIVGINNRDLATFETSLDTTLDLLGRLPDGVVVVSESGIRTPGDVARLGEGGVDAVLVGETLLRGEDPAVVARSLCGQPKARRTVG